MDRMILLVAAAVILMFAYMQRSEALLGDGMVLLALMLATKHESSTP